MRVSAKRHATVAAIKRAAIAKVANNETKTHDNGPGLEEHFAKHYQLKAQLNGLLEALEDIALHANDEWAAELARTAVDNYEDHYAQEKE